MTATAMKEDKEDKESINGSIAQEAEKKIRIQFDFSQESLANLDKLVQLLGASSRAEVIRRALTLLSDALDESQKGRRLGFKDVKGEFEGLRFT